MADPTPLRPWREEPAADDRGALLVKRVAEIPPRAVDVGSGWDDVIERVAKPKSARWLWFAAASAAVLLAWLSLQFPLAPSRAAQPAPAPVAVKAAECEEPLMCLEGAQPPAAVAPAPAVRAKPPRLAAVEPEPAVQPAVEPEPEEPALPPHVSAAAGAVWSVLVDGSVEVRRGHFEVEPGEAKLATPEVTVASLTARYAADVTEAGTFVRVFEGEVQVFPYATRQPVALRAGEERTFAPGAPPSALDVVPPEVSSPACARQSPEQRVACLANEAKGEGLKAQAALYESAYLLSRIGRATTAELTLRESLRRFPHGVLHPEVRLALIRSLYLQRRLPAAGEVAREFLSECPGDPRAADVKAFLRTLDWLESR